MIKLPIIPKIQIRPSCYRLYSQHQYGKWHKIDLSSIFVEKKGAGKEVIVISFMYIHFLCLHFYITRKSPYTHYFLNNSFQLMYNKPLVNIKCIGKPWLSGAGAGSSLVCVMSGKELSEELRMLSLHLQGWPWYTGILPTLLLCSLHCSLPLHMGGKS